MIPSRLTALVFTALLCPAAFAATATGTGPTDPVEHPKAPAIQSTPGMNTDGSGVDVAPPPATGTDPRTQGNDPGRQGGTSGNPVPPVNSGAGASSKTTTGGSGSEGSSQ
ncbi:hypothetical protein K5E40_01110 [Pseudomonas baetica]|uniref:hypothetical protein n=1 Tax=Pseudomonas TaxID=286 RepID=UPI001C8B96C3|nr:hypothetical protein [Pseudomonas baetica]MBX9404286.1 hypothetical protein [Pseudomonas baetica]